MLEELWFEYFCKPAIEHGGYNLVNTLVYGAILLAIAFFVVFPLLDKKGIKVDFKFAVALLPYSLLGSSFRVLEDLRLLERSCNPLEAGFYTYTPGIYIAIFALVIAAIAVSRIASKKFEKNFYKVFGGIGLLLALPIIGFEILQFQAWLGFLGVIAMTAGISWIVVKATERFRKGFFSNKLNMLALGGQVLDGSATFVATQFFRCGEQHVLSDIVLQLFPFGFVLVKIGLILAILHYVDREIQNENLRNFIKLFLIILGFATGLRDLMTLGVGTCL